MDGSRVPMNGALSNFLLRVGQVQQVFYPEDAQNVSKKYVEYQVLVQHRANGTAVTKLYEHCLAIDHYASVADFSFVTYRVDNKATSENGSQLEPGLGGHVILLCVNGEQNSAVILGGIRHAQTLKDEKVDGHHLHTRFNGIDVVINKDGELTLTYGGATRIDGTNVDGVEQEAIGTFVKVSRDGNVVVSDKAGENFFLIDRVNGTCRVVSKTQADLTSAKVTLVAPDATEPLVLGNQWKRTMGEILDALMKLTVTTGTGPSTPPNNLQDFAKIKAALQDNLSQASFTK